MFHLHSYLRRSTLPLLVVVCLAALSFSYAFADSSSRPLAVTVIGDPDAAVAGKFAVGSASVGSKSMTVVGVIDFLGAGSVHNYFTQGAGNNMQINTNVDEANTVGDASRSQWKLVLGSNLDQFSLRRSPAGATYDEDALFFIDGTTGNAALMTVDTGNQADFSYTPQARLDIVNDASQPTLRMEGSAGTNIFEAYNTGGGAATGLIARLERATGSFYIDGQYFGQAFNSGQGADVAERIRPSENVLPGDVVEIDPDNEGFFRKARNAVSTMVAGVISTSPGVTLNNRFAGTTAATQDDRPLIALAGRVIVNATAAYGSIELGDLLVSSPVPGYAMKCPSSQACIGAVIGKALQALPGGTGTIEIQVMLR